MKAQIKSKLPDVGTTIFTVMSQCAQEHNAINLSQGFPGFDVPDKLKAFVSEAMQLGHNQYAAMTGLLALREQVSLKIKNTYDLQISTDKEVTITSGATEAIFAAISAIVRPGDEVIVFDPAYDSYEPAVTLNGGHTRHIALKAPQFSIDWQEVKDSMNARTKMMIINFPHNPTGSVLTEEDLNCLADIVRDTNIVILSDEVYEHIVFDGLVHQSVLRRPELAARSFVVSSFGKTYHATGWKVGYCVAPTELSIEFRKVHQYLTFSTTTPMQWALAQFMKECPEHAADLPAFYQKKRDLFCRLLEGSSFQWVPTQGTYFQLLDYSAIADDLDLNMAKRLTQEIKVASIPISVFYQSAPHDRLLRFCFAKEDDVLEAAASRLCSL